MIYQHRFRVKAALNRVAGFHNDAASMAAITPPPIIIRMHAAPAVLTEGDEMDFTMWLGPLPIHWLAQIEAVSPAGFCDRQLQGPFAEWVHQHTFLAIDDGTTVVLDQIKLQLRRHLLWGPVGFGMWLGFPLLFAYRAWKTKKNLEGKKVIDESFQIIN